MVAPRNVRPVPASHPRAPAGQITHYISRRCPGRSTERLLAPEQRHDLSPRYSSRLSLFTKNRLITKPSRLTLGVGAVTVVAAAGVAIGAAASGSSGTALPAALNQAGASRAASHSTGQAVNHAGHGAAPGHAGHARLVTHGAGRHASARFTKPYLMYDSVEPLAIPRGHVIATYATGPFAVPASQLAGRGPIVWIDTIGSDPGASALDIEPGDATPAIAAAWADNRLSHRPHALAVLYTSLSEWPAVKADVAALPKSIQARVRWWIADPTGVPHLVPGSDATQWYWGSTYDISTVLPRF
jgi:hypothetical protein